MKYSANGAFFGAHPEIHSAQRSPVVYEGGSSSSSDSQTYVLGTFAEDESKSRATGGRGRLA